MRARPEKSFSAVARHYHSSAQNGPMRRITSVSPLRIPKTHSLYNGLLRQRQSNWFHEGNR